MDSPHTMRFSLILRAIATSWIAVAANAAVGLLLTPYVLHHIGDEAFGLWVLIVNCVGYYGLLDIGVRSSILRYVSRHQALGDDSSANRVVATAFYYYLGACTVIILGTLVSAGPVSHFFAIAPDLVSPFRSLYILAGVVQGVMLPLVVFAASLEACGRFDQMYLTTVAGLGVRVVAIVAVIHEGGGLYAIGAATILSQLLVYFIEVPLAFRANPALSLRPKWVSKHVFRDMLRYGSVSTAVGIGERMRGYIYPLLIAKFLSPIAVTLFSLPVKLMALPSDGIGTMTEIVNPLSSRLEAQNDFSKLRTLILNSSQTAFLLLIPIAAFLITFGRELLALWVGPQYSSAYGILVLLTLGLGAAATQCCIQSMLFGIERHKALIWYRLGEGLSVVIFGSFALRLWGLKAFAAVIACTLLLTSLFLVPRYLCKILGLSLRRYLTESIAKPLILALPMAALLVALRAWLQPEGWRDMFLVVIAGFVIYVATLSLVTLLSSRLNREWCEVGVLQVVSERILPLLRTKSRRPVGAFSSAEPFTGSD